MQEEPALGHYTPSNRIHLKRKKEKEKKKDEGLPRGRVANPNRPRQRTAGGLDTQTPLPRTEQGADRPTGLHNNESMASLTL